MGVRWRIVLATPLALAAMLAPENTERLRLPRRAARASGSFVKEVKRLLVEAPAILLGNGDEGVALGMYELAPTVNLLVGAGIGGRSWHLWAPDMTF